MIEFLKILTLVKGYYKHAALNVFFNVLGMLFSAFSIILLIPIMEILFNQDGKVQKILENKPVTDFFSDGYSLKEHGFYFLAEQIQLNGSAVVLMYVCIMVVLFTFLKNASIYFALYFIAVIRNGVIKDYRNTMYSQILNLQLSFFSEEKKGDIISKMTNDLKEVEWSILKSIEATFRDPLNIVIYFVILIWMSPELTLFLAVFFPIAGVMIGFIAKRLRGNATKGQSKLGDLIAFLEESISGLRIIKGFSVEEKSIRRFDQLNKEYNRLMIKMYRKADLASPMSEFLGIMLIAAVLWYGGLLAIDGNIDGSFFIAYIAFLSQLISPFKAITKAYSNAQKGLSAINRIKDITEAEVLIFDQPDAKNIKSLNSDISFSNVSFKYEKDWVLNDVSLELKKGQTIALVGQSGSGKTTLADLLPRFYEPQKGQVKIDDVPINELSLKSLRSLLGIVTQESILFNDTIFNNIAFSVENATKEDVENAAKIANAHDFIMSFENGYDSIVGDGGGKLSGGQKQRIAIARAVLKNPDVLILDEATSALDTEAEKLVQQALHRLMKNRTSLVIAHRLSTIQHADCILVMNKGEIVERGTHQELIEKDGVYNRLIQMQSFS